MTQHVLAVVNRNRPEGLVVAESKAERSRLRAFAEWQDKRGLNWMNPGLTAWRDELLAGGLAPSSVAAYIGTVKGAYKRLLQDNRVRDELLAIMPDGSPADRLTMLNEVLRRIENEAGPLAAPVSVTTRQDRADSEHVRLTAAQAAQLLEMPGLATLAGIRDTALIALAVCTGLREAEIVALDVADLRQTIAGELAIRVRAGKGNKARLVPYGDGAWCLVIVDAWLQRAGIVEGPVFRPLNRYGKSVRLSNRQGQPRRLSTFSIQRALAQYRVPIGGELRTIKPHDLRRSYARLNYDAGLDITALQQNLGHKDIKTTLHYVGTLDAARRRGRISIPFSFAGLYEQGKF